MQLEGILMLMGGLVASAILTPPVMVVVVVVALLVGGMVTVLMGVGVAIWVRTAAEAAAAAGLEAQVLMLPVLEAALEVRLRPLLPKVRLFFLITNMLDRFLHTRERTAKIILTQPGADAGGVGRLERRMY